MNSDARPGIFDLSFDELQACLSEWGQPSYRARQIWAWLYHKLAASFDEMSDLPLPLRDKLNGAFSFSRLRPVSEQVSSDGYTRKSLFELPGAAQVESVLMTYDKRCTVCVSTQAGCAMGCSFCATGQGGLQRNLSAGEIVEQVLSLARAAPHQAPAKHPSPLSNVVFMGMGEPLANYDNFVQAARRLNDPAGFNLGARRMTVSTVGLTPGIQKLAREALQINLAISLHAATDELRDRLVPVNKRYPLSSLMQAVRDYSARTHRRVSFEWALIENVNDSPEQARVLLKLVKGLVCHVNLIPLNPTAEFSGVASRRKRLEAFCAVLEGRIPHTLRLRRGLDIQAGCGQLRQREGHAV
ncbi:MAG: 23S rRNA (adenine(2503)-C(2))-methyltransferase RlmN [Thermoflexales bacterium]|nr:23S rRNA (adenine(2503)-C(2))-methyltransferase RlmN [Thermoflexales bacterium]